MDTDELAIQRGKKMVWTLAKAATLNDDAADDITQDVFLDALKYRDIFERSEKPKGLLYTMAKHKIYSYFRREKHFMEFDPYQYDEPTDTETVEEIIRRENARELHDAIAALPDKYAQIIELIYYHDLSLREIANMTGEKYNTLKWRKMTALKMLRRNIGNIEGQDSPGRSQKLTIRGFIMMYEVQLWTNADLTQRDGFLSL